jgi:hypothetical protein
MEWLGFRYCIGVLVEGVFLVLSLPSSSAWVSESWFLPTFLRLSLFLGYFSFLSRDEGVCLYISVGVFRLFFSFPP